MTTSTLSQAWEMPEIVCSAPAEVVGVRALKEIHVSDADCKFLSRFENCELPEAEWTHFAHVRVAWVYLKKFPPQVALQQIRNGILRYNTEVLGRRHKYHETVTVAFVRVVFASMRASESWTQFAQRSGELLDAEKPILLKYYSATRLFSDAARRELVEPDLENIPCLPES